MRTSSLIVFSRNNVIIIFFLIALISCTSEETKIKKSFEKIIASDYKKFTEQILKEQKEEFQDTECKRNPKLTALWQKTLASEPSGYTYNIEKTDSIVSPYIAKATYKIKFTNQYGESEEECKNAEPRTEEKEIQLVFAYQDNKWVFKGAGIRDD